MFTVSLPVAIHHRIVHSGQSKNPANWHWSRRIGSARRHSGFAASSKGASIEHHTREIALCGGFEVPTSIQRTFIITSNLKTTLEP